MIRKFKINKDIYYNTLDFLKKRIVEVCGLILISVFGVFSYSLINYSPKNRPNRQNFTNQFIENGSIYIIKSKLFKKTKSRLSGKIGLYEMPESLSIEIDSTDDLKLATHFLKQN